MSIGQLFHLDPRSEYSLQKQIVEQIAAAIIRGSIPADHPLPSSRSLARQLQVGRNTVILAYERLLEDGYLISRERSGYFVNPEILAGSLSREAPPAQAAGEAHPDWRNRFKLAPLELQQLDKPRNWQEYPYPFIYGQMGSDLFPLINWRECARDAASARAVQRWTVDRPDDDDPLLVEQICTRLLPRRGIWADPEQVLVTVGAQHGLYLLFQLLLDKDSVLGLENPGYVDVRNIAALSPAATRSLDVGPEGLAIDDTLDGCDCIYVTPSHQSPTTVTLPLARRYQLLEKAAAQDIVLIEDDYESEFNYLGNPLPALKSLDTNDRVIYLGSLSKTIAPGLRMGYLVGATELIAELRALRRLMLRHPAANNQHALALFLSRGYHDSQVRNLVSTYRERHRVMGEALDHHLPGSSPIQSFGGTSFWVRGRQQLDARALAARAAQSGIIIEPGHTFFQQENPPLNCFRLGFSAITGERIAPGIERLSAIIDELI